MIILRLPKANIDKKRLLAIIEVGNVSFFSICNNLKDKYLLF